MVVGDDGKGFEKSYLYMIDRCSPLFHFCRENVSLGLDELFATVRVFIYV